MAWLTRLFGMPPFAARYRDLALGAALVLTLFATGALLTPFYPALLWALTLSILTAPIAKRVERRMGRFGQTLGALAGVFVAMFGIVLPFIIVGLALYARLQDLQNEVGSLGDLAHRLEAALQPYASRFGLGHISIGESIQNNQEALVNAAKAPATAVAQGVGLSLFTLIVALLTQFFMLRDGRALREPAFQLSPVPPGRTEALLQRLVATVRAVFMGTVFVSVIQATVMGLFYHFTGVPNALLLAVLMAGLGIIPLVGAPFVYFPVAVGLAVAGQVPLAVASLLFGMLIVSNIDNVLKPFLIGGPAKLHPIAVFFAALGGVALIGPVGVVAGPMLLVIVLFLTDVLRERLASG